MASNKTAAPKKRSSSRPSSVTAKKVVKPKTAFDTKAATKKTGQQEKMRPTTSPKDILQAGLSALSIPRAESAMADGLSKIADSFGFKKLEDVFDQRVASALERIGIPSAEKLNQLMKKVEELSAIIKAKKTKASK
jgi:Poly(hydroxyalcanoate) granule associated protein (phasin)